MSESDDSKQDNRPTIKDPRKADAEKRPLDNLSLSELNNLLFA